MSNYPDWWDKKITIYNKYTDNSTRVVTWYRTVLTDPLSFWKEVGDRTVVGNVTLDTKSIICRRLVESDRQVNKVYTSNRRYYRSG